MDLLDHVYGLLEDPEMSRIVWLKGTAGVRKSAVAFTAAERMRAPHMKDQTSSEKRLAGTFFLSRKYMERCTFLRHLSISLPFWTLESPPAIRWNFPFFLTSWEAQTQTSRVSAFGIVIDTLDECISEAEITLLISLLGQTLRDPGLPVTHILLTKVARKRISLKSSMEKKCAHWCARYQ